MGILAASSNRLNLLSQIPPQHHHQMTVAEANEFFLDFEQQQPQQEPVANVLPQSMLPIVAGDEQLAQETVAQILSQATTTAATHIMLPLPPPPPPSQVGYLTYLSTCGNHFLCAF